MKMRIQFFVLSIFLVFFESELAMSKSVDEWENCRDKVLNSSPDSQFKMAKIKHIPKWGLNGMEITEMAVNAQCGEDPQVKSQTVTTDPASKEPTDKSPESAIGFYSYTIASSKVWKKKFIRILNGKYRDFIERLSVGTTTRLDGEWIIGEGNAPHHGGSDNAAFVIHRASGQVFCAMIENGNRLYWFGFSSWQQAPRPLQIWSTFPQTTWRPTYFSCPGASQRSLCIR